MKQSHCFHCGLPLGERGKRVVVANVSNVERSFCCQGCATAAQIIDQLGLLEFYRYRSNSSESESSVFPMPEFDQTEDGGSSQQQAINKFIEFDEDALQSEFVHVRGDHKAANLAISGISCAACVWLLENYLKRIDGVCEVSVNLAENRALVEWSDAQLKLSEIMAAIASLGYSPRPWIPASEYLRVKAENRRFLQRTGVAGLLMMQTGMFAIAMYSGAIQGMEHRYEIFLRWASLLLAIPLLTYSAAPFFQRAWYGIRSRAAGMDVPVVVAISVAFVASVVATFTGKGEIYYDSIAMFTFFLLLGRYLEMRVRQSGNLASLNLGDQLPAVATRLEESGQSLETGQLLVPVSRLNPGDRVLVRPGEHIPCDAIVERGESAVNEASFTGESAPRKVLQGDVVSAGTLNMHGALELTVEATGAQSRFYQLLMLIDRAMQDKSPLQTMADRLARYFVLAIFLIVACVGISWWYIDSSQLLPVVISVLIVSCPCALSLATPLALHAGGQRMKRWGMVLTRSGALEDLAKVDTVVFDKTGTLTTGEITLEGCEALGDIDAQRCAEIAALLESRSEHPLAKAFPCSVLTPSIMQDWRYRPGCGVEAVIDGRRYRLGSAPWIRAEMSIDPALSFHRAPHHTRSIWLADDKAVLARFDLADSLRPESAKLIGWLIDNGIAVEIASGDADSEVRRVAGQLGVEVFASEQTPSEKLARVKALVSSGRKVLVVGDGVNDVPILAAGTVSIAMANSSDLAKAKADCFLLNEGISHVGKAMAFSRKVRAVIQQNFAWALCYNGIAIPAAAMAWVPPWLAAIGMSLSSLTVALNAGRLGSVSDVGGRRSVPTIASRAVLREASAVDGVGGAS